MAYLFKIWVSAVEDISNKELNLLFIQQCPLVDTLANWQHTQETQSSATNADTTLAATPGTDSDTCFTTVTTVTLADYRQHAPDTAVKLLATHSWHDKLMTTHAWHNKLMTTHAWHNKLMTTHAHNSFRSSLLFTLTPHFNTHSHRLYIQRTKGSANIHHLLVTHALACIEHSRHQGVRQSRTGYKGVGGFSHSCTAVTGRSGRVTYRIKSLMANV